MHPVMRQLHDDHGNVARLLDFIRGQLDLAAGQEQPDYERLHQVMHYLTHYPDVFHHPREDELFAMLLKKDPSSQLAIHQLQQEHEILAEKGDTLRQRLREKLGGRRLQWRSLARELRDYADLLEQHMLMEERSVFPLAKLLLKDKELDAVASRISQREDPLFGRSVASPYASLLHTIERGSSLRH